MSEAKVPENVQKLAGVLKKEMKVGDGGVVEVSEDAFEKTLEGTGLEADDFKKTQDHRDNVVSAMGLALGEVGTEAMKKKKDLPQVSAEMKVHKDVIGGVFSRSKQVPDGQGGMQEKHGMLSMRVQANGAANKGSLKKVKQHLAEEAKKVLG